MAESTLYRVLWGALGDDDKARLALVATGVSRPTRELTDSIREAEQSLDIGGLPVVDVLTPSSRDETGIDTEFLAWVRSRG